MKKLVFKINLQFLIEIEEFQLTREIPASPIQGAYSPDEEVLDFDDETVITALAERIQKLGQLEKEELIEELFNLDHEQLNYHVVEVR